MKIVYGGRGGRRGIVPFEYSFWADSAGDGGIAGKGGNIKVSENCKIYSYNGNKYTDSTEYNDGENQLEIYAQGGILRSVYKLNSWWNYKENYNYEFFSGLFGTTIAENVDKVIMAETYNELELVCVRYEQSCEKSGYINPETGSEQGVGSGAGYIELSNGTYEVDPSLN